jgi:hypothetical protein
LFAIRINDPDFRGFNFVVTPYALCACDP